MVQPHWSCCFSVLPKPFLSPQDLCTSCSLPRMSFSAIFVCLLSIQILTLPLKYQLVCHLSKEAFQAPIQNRTPTYGLSSHSLQFAAWYSLLSKFFLPISQIRFMILFSLTSLVWGPKVLLSCFTFYMHVNVSGLEGGSADTCCVNEIVNQCPSRCLTSWKYTLVVKVEWQAGFIE